MPTYRAIFVRALGNASNGLATITDQNGLFQNPASFVAIETPPAGIAAIEAKALSSGGLTFTATEDPANIEIKLNAEITKLTSDYAAALTAQGHKATPSGCVASSSGAYTFSLYPTADSPGPYPTTLVSSNSNHDCDLHYLLGVEEE